MNLSTFAAQSKVRVIIGKGGVGKTAVSGALALALAQAGTKVSLLELEGRPELAEAFGLDDLHHWDPIRVVEDPSGGWVELRHLTPDDALIEYLSTHGLGRLSKRLGRTGLLDVVASAIPGIKDVLVLGKVKQLAKRGEADVIILDAPATGHAVTLLTSAAGLADVARSGPVRRQADEVIDLLTDPARCQVSIVTLPEDLPVTEAVEAAYLVEDRAGVALGPVIANRVDSASELLMVPAATAAAEAGLQLESSLLAALDGAAEFQRHRSGEAHEALTRLRAELPLEVLQLPRLSAVRLGPSEIALLAGYLSEQIESLAEPL
jgi:anion-transporting  ArsA/GET3 family ATPase